MDRKTIILLVLLIVSPVIIYILWPSDENRIRKLFREGAAAVEQKNIDGVLSKISFAYKDENGLSYLSLRDLMKRFFSQHEKLRVDYAITDIRITDNTATAEIDLRMIATAGNETGYIVGDTVNPHHLKFSLEKERATWLVTKSEGIRIGF